MFGASSELASVMEFGFYYALLTHVMDRARISVTELPVKATSLFSSSQQVDNAWSVIIVGDGQLLVSECDAVVWPSAGHQPYCRVWLGDLNGPVDHVACNRQTHKASHVQRNLFIIIHIIIIIIIIYYAKRQQINIKTLTRNHKTSKKETTQTLLKAPPKASDAQHQWLYWHSGSKYSSSVHALVMTMTVFCVLQVMHKYHFV